VKVLSTMEPRAEDCLKPQDKVTSRECLLASIIVAHEDVASAPRR
jgi:hypothetical protein